MSSSNFPFVPRNRLPIESDQAFLAAVANNSLNTKVISGNLNESLENITHLEVTKNDLHIIVSPFTGVEKFDKHLQTKTVIETPLQPYTFDLTIVPYTLAGIVNVSAGMTVYYDYMTEIPRKLRGSNFRHTQTWTEEFVDTVRYLTLHDLYEFCEPTTQERQPFNMNITYNNLNYPNSIFISLPTNEN